MAELLPLAEAPAARPARMACILQLLAAVVSGALLALAYPTWDVPAMLWVWMFPLLAALWSGGDAGQSKKRLFALGWLSGFVFFLLVLRWLRDIHGAGAFLSILGWGALSAYLACYTGLWALFAGTVGRVRRQHLLANPAHSSPRPGVTPALHVIRLAALNGAAWVVLEWLRGWLLGGFGWNGLGVALHENLPMIQLAEFTGVAGLAFVPVFVSVCLFATAWRMYLRARGEARRLTLNLDFSAAMFLLLAVFVFGLRAMARHGQATDKAVQVVIVQRNIPQDLKWDPTLALDHVHGYYDALTAALRQREHERTEAISRAMRAGGQIAVNLAPPDIILLPESALPLYLADPNVEEFAAAALEAAGPGAVLVTGIDDAEPAEPPRFFNTIAVLDGSARAPQVYRKMNLVPFGEYLPLRWFPPMRWLAGAAVPGDFHAGTSTEPLHVRTRAGEIGLIPLICFEDTLGRHARRFVSSATPQILTNATNDGWFADPAAALQHAANAKFRCVELRRPMLRAANTGLSCAISPTGAILADIRDPVTRSPQVADVLFASLPLGQPRQETFFARFGDVFALACAVLVGLALLQAYLRRCQNPNPLP